MTFTIKWCSLIIIAVLRYVPVLWLLKMRRFNFASIAVAVPTTDGDYVGFNTALRRHHRSSHRDHCR